jgi:hypothetical protein
MNDAGWHGQTWFDSQYTVSSCPFTSSFMALLTCSFFSIRKGRMQEDQGSKVVEHTILFFSRSFYRVQSFLDLLMFPLLVFSDILSCVDVWLMKRDAQ